MCTKQFLCNIEIRLSFSIILRDESSRIMHGDVIILLFFNQINSLKLNRLFCDKFKTIGFVKLLKYPLNKFNIQSNLKKD